MRISEKDVWTGIFTLGACILIGKGLKMIMPLEKPQEINTQNKIDEKKDNMSDSLKIWGQQEKSYFEGKQLIDSVK